MRFLQFEVGVGKRGGRGQVVYFLVEMADYRVSIGTIRVCVARAMMLYDAMSAAVAREHACACGSNEGW